MRLSLCFIVILLLNCNSAQIKTDEKKVIEQNKITLELVKEAKSGLRDSGVSSELINYYSNVLNKCQNSLNDSNITIEGLADSKQICLNKQDKQTKEIVQLLKYKKRVGVDNIIIICIIIFYILKIALWIIRKTNPAFLGLDKVSEILQKIFKRK